MNPFNRDRLPESPERREIVKRLEKVLCELYLNDVESYGEKFNFDRMRAEVGAIVDFQHIYMHTSAYMFFGQQPETSLPIDERMAIAAHEAFKKVTA